jgi:carbamoyltransferase
LKLLGISAHYHDSAAAIIDSGKVIAAAQEERFTRKKHDAGFPTRAVEYCLEQSGFELLELDGVVYYDKPLLKFERLLETYLAYAPRGLQSFIMSMPVWLKEKLYLKSVLKKELAKIADCKTSELPKLMFAEHHQSHAASAFYPSPFERAAVICMDGVGEWATTSVWLGDGNKLEPKWEINFPHSLGMLYSAFTYYTGFKVNSGEYKLMGLAPYGEPKYKDLILEHLIDLKDDGSFRLDMQYFNYATGLTMTNDRFAKLFGGPARTAESQISQKEMDIARSIQAVTEEVVLKLATSVKKELGVDYLCLAGGVALNCVSNGRLLREGPYKDIWVQPAAGDAGGALGCALAVHYGDADAVRKVDKPDSMHGSYLGPSFSGTSIETPLKKLGAVYQVMEDQNMYEKLAELLDDGKVIGWFQGRMEFGPRALGGRSIIGDPRSSQMQSVMNLKIKYRESFRPFAPSVRAEKVADWFEQDSPSPYMLMVAPIQHDKRLELNEHDQSLFGIDKLNVARSQLPAVTHVDYSARIQTVHEDTNPRYYRLLEAFENRTDCPVLINTSFNVRGEPIVCTPEDAYRCFMRTEMDYLVIENYLLSKPKQPEWQDDDQWKQEFELD